MLRRKLMVTLGALILLLLGLAVGAVLLLQDMLDDLDHVRHEAIATVDDVSELSSRVALIQIELYRLRLGTQHHLDMLLDEAEALQGGLERIRHRDATHDPAAQQAMTRLWETVPQFYRHVGLLATVEDSAFLQRHHDAALSSAVSMSRDLLQLSEVVRKHASGEQFQLANRFRWLVLAMAGAFMVVINASILLLMRAAQMVLKPMDKLVEASRALGEERFDHRVTLSQEDEFGELAQAYNSLARQLQANEQRRLETLGHAALTLNHELNNAMAIIELQLQLLKRSTRGDAMQEKYLNQIHQSLRRMTQTVESLKRIRRIVLTDYTEGVKMLDLDRSTQEYAPKDAVLDDEGKRA